MVLALLWLDASILPLRAQALNRRRPPLKSHHYRMGHRGHRHLHQHPHFSAAATET